MGPIMAGLGGRGMRRSIPVFGGLKSSAERTPSESSGLRLIGVHVKMHIFGVPTLVRQIPSQMPPSLVQPEVNVAGQRHRDVQSFMAPSLAHDTTHVIRCPIFTRQWPLRT